MKNIRDMSIEEIEALPRYGIDDKVMLGCKACGKCCLNRHDIVLTSYDVFRIARYLQRSPEEIIERYCEWYIGRTSKMPVVHLLPIPPRDACPFLRNKKCSIHKVKPIVCRVFPFARLSSEEYERPQYILGQASCGEKPIMREFTVNEWIQDAASAEAESAAKIWGDALTSIHPILIETIGSLSKDSADMLQNALYIALYLNYRIDEDFAKQLSHNAERIAGLLDDYKKMIDGSCQDNLLHE